MIYTSKKANTILKIGSKYISYVFESDNCLGLHDYIGFKISDNREESSVFTTKRARKIISAFPQYKLVMEIIKVEGKC